MPSLKIRRIDTSSPHAVRQLAALKNPFADQANVVTSASKKLTQAVFGEPLTPVKAVEKICTDVRNKGLASVLHYTEHFDKVRLTARQIRVQPEDMAAAFAAADPAFIDTARRIRDNVLQFQIGLMSKDALLPVSEHFELHLRHRPLHRVGVCVPGGAAAYPSTLLMTVCPAQAAEVKDIVVVMPPTANGANNRDMLAICHLLGVKEVYRIGGAQAVAALAYGVDGIPPVDMIVGPGNIFVTLAKRFVFGSVAIDCLAGPTEVLVAADESAQPDFVALDLIAQAEHSPGVSLLVTWHNDLPDEVEKSMNKQLNHLARGDQARACLEEYGAFVVVKDRAEGVKIVNELAPEHLHVQTRDPEAFADKVDNAGAIFLGPFTPVALGDYAAGPSHVLPTGGTARFASGLSVNDFRRRTSIINFTRAGLREIADDVISMATKEGLTAHAASVSARVADKPLQLRPSKKAAAAAAKLKK
jgi:histidinol dehydrogenase